jgi:Fe-S-cluster containining protein
MTQFVCRRCGRCCGLVPFTKPEYKAVYRIAKGMGITLIKQYIHNEPVYVPRSILNKLGSMSVQQLLERGSIECPFLERDTQGTSGCRIYKLRPQICRLFGSNAEQHPLLRCPHQEDTDAHQESDRR